MWHPSPDTRHTLAIANGILKMERHLRLGTRSNVGETCPPVCGPLALRAVCAQCPPYFHFIEGVIHYLYYTIVFAKASSRRRC